MVESKNLSIVLCNTSNIENSKSIANKLVEQNLAACVNIIPKIHSVYEWNGKIESEEESTMLIKTTSELLEKVEEVILKFHSYDTPEILAFKIDKSNKDYLQWLVGAIKS
jgi:periplasmic divalent cation tolerance protein